MFFFEVGFLRQNFNKGMLSYFWIVEMIRNEKYNLGQAFCMWQMSGISCLNLVVFKYNLEVKVQSHFLKTVIGFMVPGCSDHLSDNKLGSPPSFLNLFISP